MKYRMGFVSNSSSSSYIVWPSPMESINDEKLDLKDAFIDEIWTQFNEDDGEIEFGWAKTTYSGFHNKLNFAIAQAGYLDTENNTIDTLQMIEKVIREHTGLKPIHPNFFEKALDIIYIDHSSSATDGQNVEIFESENSLKTFLFDPRCYIQGGNDNSEPCEDHNE